MKKLKKLFIVIIFLLINANIIEAQELKAKEYDVIELKEFYDNIGIIFPESYIIEGKPFYHEKRFTPSITEIKEAEEILSHIVNMILGNSGNWKRLANIKLRNCYRQYLGFINDQGEKLIFIEMVDISTPNARKLLDDLYKGPILFFDGFTEYYRPYVINIETKELDKSSYPLMDEYWFIRSVDTTDSE